MVDWIYNNPIWLWGPVLLAIGTGLSLLGLLVVHRYVNIDLRRAHHDVTAAAMSMVGVAYAVLIAFVAVSAWESYSSSDSIVDAEASYIGNLYRDIAGLPEEKAGPIKADIKKYLEIVIGTEWQQQQQGRSPTDGRETLVHAHALIAGLKPENMGEQAIMAELLDTINQLYSARRTRLLAADNAIPEVLWWIIGIGTAVTVSFSFLFGPPDFHMHVAITILVAASMSLVLVLLVALDRPFRGDLSISSESFEHVRDSIAAAEGAAPAAR